MKLRSYLAVSLITLTLGISYGCGGGSQSPSPGPNPGPNSNVDTIPDQFSFSGKCAQALNTDVLLDPITVSGIDAPASISVAGGEYSIDNGTCTTANGTVTNGKQVRVRPVGGRLTTSGPSATITLTIGGVSASTVITSDPCVQVTH
jgi:hypothetical protein